MKIKNTLYDKCSFIDDGRWIENLITYALKFSNSFYKVSSKAMMTISKDLEMIEIPDQKFDHSVLNKPF